ncbi:MAG: 23S rRNA (adenine(2503)-C(2))-methyltransferase RlmN [Candidatus Omnitrophota bacterium]
MKKDILNFTLVELKKEILKMNEASHRADQIFLGLYKKRVDKFNAITTLSKNLILKLDEKFTIGSLICEKRLMSKDKSEKFLFKTKDDQYLETVLIKEKTRRTVCVSTQIGCKYKCRFCASGLNGFIRNLTVSEITGQILLAGRLSPEKITNVVFMGMGEPLDNYENVKKAVFLINDSKAMGVGARKITISTCGIIPGIKKLMDIGVQVELSVSLHAADEALRNKLVPVNEKYPLKDLIKTCREYYAKTHRIITLEYILIKDQNDSVQDADKLALIANKIRAKVNLIKCNDFRGLECIGSDQRKVISFRDRLIKQRVKVTIRKSRGEDILAACGQLAAKMDQ